MTRRRSAFERPLGGRRSDLERRTDEPSTAMRAVRSRDATVLGYRGSRPGETDQVRMTYPERLRVLAATVATVAPAGAGAIRAVDRLELLEAPPGADRDAGQGTLREVHRHLRLMPEALVEAVQERASAGEHDAAVHDVCGELRRRLV